MVNRFQPVVPLIIAYQQMNYLKARNPLAKIYQVSSIEGRVENHKLFRQTDFIPYNSLSGVNY